MFLGLCGYYWRYVKDFVAHAAPLHELTKKDTTYIQDDCRQESFNFLKQTLHCAPILAMSQDVSMYVLDVNTSDMAVGAVLQQEQGGTLQILGYAS